MGLSGQWPVSTYETCLFPLKRVFAHDPINDELTIGVANFSHMLAAALRS